MKNNIRKGLLPLVVSGLLLVDSNTYSATGDAQGRDLALGYLG